ncbi:MAG: DUF5011 domain-containing protein [Ruminococcaceae bacterium]|nr:DUF5011 domain-containing protein [Oscillospiraceae bacterium]
MKKWLKKLPAVTKAVALIALVLGIVGGAVFCTLAFQKDDFELKGTKQFSLTVCEESYTYTEEGVVAICFGRDVSDTLKIEFSEGIVDNGNGTYTIPTDKAGIYTITYTVDCYKFGENREDGTPIKRIRVFTVDEVEEDGRAAGLDEEVDS